MSTKHNHTPPDYLAGLPSLPDILESTPEAEEQYAKIVALREKAIRDHRKQIGGYFVEQRPTIAPIEMRVRTNGATRINKSHERE